MKLFYYLLRAKVKLSSFIMQWIYQMDFKFKLNALGVRYGNNVKCLNGFLELEVSRHAKKVWFDDSVIFNSVNTAWYSNCKVTVGENAELTMGKHSGMNGALIFCMNRITIGNHLDIGGGTRIYDTNFHSIDYRYRRDFDIDRQHVITAPVTIGDDVFIGTGCIIGKGITIGDRSVIAAGSVVVKDIPADCIAGGDPCKVIKMMNNE